MFHIIFNSNDCANTEISYYFGVYTNGTLNTKETPAQIFFIISLLGLQVITLTLLFHHIGLDLHYVHHDFNIRKPLCRTIIFANDF